MANSTGRPMVELKVCWPRRGPVDYAQLTTIGSAFDQAFRSRSSWIVALSPYLDRIRRAPIDRPLPSESINGRGKIVLEQQTFSYSDMTWALASSLPLIFWPSPL
jgi:hypothetical protein